MRLISRAFAALVAIVTVPAMAQDRTGSNARPQPLPDYAKPPSAAPLVAPPAVPDVTSVSAATTQFSDVKVTAETAGNAPALPSWQPKSDSGPVVLDRPDATGFSADWVRRQFIANAIVGAPVALDRVVAVVQAINLAFIANGYLNSGVLLGDAAASSGILDVHLVYGRLAGDPAMRVSWDSGDASGLRTGFITERMRATRAIPLDAIAVERQFRLLAEDPAIATVRAELIPGIAPGEASLSLIVDPARRADAYVTIANSRSPAIGGTRIAIGGSLRNVLGSGDIVSVEGGSTAGRLDVSGSYDTQIFAPAWSLSLRGAINNAAVVDAPLIPLDIRAEESSIEGGIGWRAFARPLLPRATGGWTSAQSLTFGLKISHRDSRTWLLGQPFSFSPGSVDGRARTTALRLTGDFVERGIATVTALSLTATQGLAGTRPVAVGVIAPDPGFRSISGQLSHARRLTNHGLELRLRLTGQWADGILYSSERLAAGGEYSVRGYRETLILADTGIIGSVELAQPFSLSRRGRDAKGVDWGAFSVSAFSDAAYLRNRAGPAPSPGEIGSVGVSLAWVPSDAITARITYARPLVNAVPVGSRDLQDRGVQFRVTVRPFQLFR